MYKIIVQNINTALQDIGIQYSTTIFGNQTRYLPWAVPQVNLMFLLIFQNVCNARFFKSIWFGV